jgi:hypothetical protein
MNQRPKRPRPLSELKKRELLAKFKKMIARASKRRRDFELKCQGDTYSASLTTFGRIIVRDALGTVVVASGYNPLGLDD